MFQAYHGVTAGQHQSNFDHLSAEGYRMISLSVYGDPGDARYAAVWVQRSGPAWVAVHGVNAAGYQSFFDNQTAHGYVPVLVSAAGTASDAVFDNTDSLMTKFLPKLRRIVDQKSIVWTLKGSQCHPGFERTDPKLPEQNREDCPERCLRLHHSR